LFHLVGDIFCSPDIFYHADYSATTRFLIIFDGGLRDHALFFKKSPYVYFRRIALRSRSHIFMPVCMSCAFRHAGSSGGGAVGAYQAFMDLGMTLASAIMGIVIPFTGTY
jgi:hypothetical protein